MGNDGSDADEDCRRLRREEDERERNRREVMERKRQWEVVNSDDEGGSGSSRKRESRGRASRSYSSSRSQSRSEDDDDDSRDRHRRGRQKKHKKKSSSRHRRRSRSRSVSSSSRSRSRSRYKDRIHRTKDRKKYHRSKDRKKRHHKRKESKKHKKKSHRPDRRERSKDRHGDKRRDDSASYSSSSLSDNERQILEKNAKQGTVTASGASSGPSGAACFGKYGIVNPTDLHSNARVKSSFERWLSQIKGVPDFNGPKHELLEYFKEYAEDYNTATLPHVKYYDHDKWEMEEYARKKREATEVAAARKDGEGGNVALDELRHREEMAERAKRKRLEEARILQYSMTAEKREEMKHQAQLRHEMAVAYKTGDEETRKKLQRRLEPEEIAKR